MATKTPVKYEGQQHLPFAPGDTLPIGIAPVVTDETLTGDGTSGSPLVANCPAGGGGPGPMGPTGPSGVAGVTDTSTVDLTFINNVLSGAIKISGDPNNCLELRGNGLFIDCAGGQPPPPPATATSISITTTTPNVTEGNAAQFRLALDVSDTNPIDVTIVYSGTEFDAHPAGYASQVVTIPAGTLVHFFNKGTFADLVVEPDRVLTATISGTSPALTIAVPAASVNILDDEQSSTIVQPPTFDEDFACQFRASNHDAAAAVRLRFEPNGLWTLSHHGGSGPINMLTGSWHVGTPSNAALFEIRATGTEYTVFTNTPGLNNPGTEACPGSYNNETPYDTGWQSLGTALELVAQTFAQANTFCDQNMTETRTFTVEIREIANPTNAVSGSGSICAESDAMAN